MRLRRGTRLSLLVPMAIFMRAVRSSSSRRRQDNRCQALAEPAMRCRRVAEMKGTRELFGLMPGRHKAEGMTRRIGEDTRAVGRRLIAELRGA
jgi:hypothetical protein